MKKLITLMVSIAMAAALVSCGDTSAMDKLIEKAESSSAAAEGTLSESADSSEDGTETDESEIDDYLSYVPEPSSNTLADKIDAKNGDIDIDLTMLNPTMTYTQVYDMTINPDGYEGKKVRAAGTFAYTTEDGKEYFAAIVRDATACCSQGIEFVLADERKYPDDYPPLDSEITITGTFNSYKEGNYVYIQLLDATLTTAAG